MVSIGERVADRVSAEIVTSSKGYNTPLIFTATLRHRSPSFHSNAQSFDKPRRFFDRTRTHVGRGCAVLMTRTT
jgi:hypothetical protein